MQLGELWDHSVRHRPQEEEQDHRFCFEYVESEPLMYSQVVMSLTSFCSSIKWENIMCLHLSHRAIVENKQDQTHKRALKRTHYWSIVIIIKIKALTLSFSCCQIQKAHSNFTFETAAFVVSHTFILFCFLREGRADDPEKQCKQHIYFQRHLRSRIWRQKDPRPGSKKSQALVRPWTKSLSSLGLSCFIRVNEGSYLLISKISYCSQICEMMDLLNIFSFTYLLLMILFKADL